jgi:hypothetical protein
MSTSPLARVGLDLVASRLPIGLGELAAEPMRIVLGRADLAGSSRPLPSSAALLRLDDQEVWVPAPMEPPEPEEGRGAVYLHGGQELVLPFIRLFVSQGDQEPDDAGVQYLSLSDWLHDAVAAWRFEPLGRDGPPRTLIDHLAEEGPSRAESLAAIARVLWFALFGSASPAAVCGLRLPACPMWLRPAGETPFGRRLARGLVVTARLAADAGRPAVPSTNLRAAAYRIRPAEPRDWGLDPVHTPEGADIRLTGHLGVGVAVRDRKLHWVGPEPPLSASSARLPFAGCNDPRRLLMAANMQAHAMPLPQSEPPCVRMGLVAGAPGLSPVADAPGSPPGDEDPPGVNLRVGYLAWQGWNHEDAWVLSESAARRLGTTQTLVQTIASRAVELAPELLVQEGQRVERGELLVRRFVAPALLCSTVETLAALPDLDDRVVLQPEVDDAAPESGTVVQIETWDLRDRSGIPADWHLPDAVSGAFRAVYRIHIERPLPLAVGDKLANRHGHKGVVGAILPDREMPLWDDRPLEALIDPISVLNRSNWGQVYETLAGALLEPGQARDVRSVRGEQVRVEAQRSGADARGRWLLEPPVGRDWLEKEVWAVAGIQFVMRMPHHACDKISGSPVPPPSLGLRLRRRSQRLGEMEHWALWAHGGQGPAAGGDGGLWELSPTAARLRRLLAAAGFAMDVAGKSLRVRRLALDAAPPADMRILSLRKENGTSTRKSKAGGGRETASLRPLAELYDALDEVGPETPTALVFDPPLTPPPRRTQGDDKDEVAYRWLPVLPARDRPPQRLFDGSEEPHELTAGLRRIVRLLRRRQQRRETADADDPSPAHRANGGEDPSLARRANGGEDPSLARRANGGEDPSLARRANGEDVELYYAVRRLLSDAGAAAVGRGATGPFSSKLAFLRRGVLGRRVPRSGRATVSPGGTLALDLDEIGLPPALAHTLFGPDLPRAGDALAAAVAGKQVWLKRDPVLHRWGLLPVRVRVVPGDTIRLPASLLGPLGADFDGDTVALFAALPGAPADPAPCSPPALAWHPLLEEAMFKPGKQYLCGLHLLGGHPEALERLQAALRAAGAPPWPDEKDARRALATWIRQAGGPEAKGRWWAVLETHALDALADDPAMGLGLGSAAELAQLPVVQCGAAKDLYSGQAMDYVLRGESLAIYRREQRIEQDDPIAAVMVAAKASIGQFGGALRRLIYTAGDLRADDVQRAQCLTEQVTQKALSVKAGEPPLEYADFERQLRRLLKRQRLTEEDREELQRLLKRVSSKLGAIWEALGERMPEEAEAWLQWLRQPHELAELVAEKGEVCLPLDDLRLRAWTEAAKERAAEGQPVVGGTVADSRAEG